MASDDNDVTYGYEKNIYILWLLFQDELDIEAVSVGAILSDYQRVRVENV